MIAATLQEEEILCSRSRWGGTAPLFEIRMESTFLYFLRYINKSILK